MKAHSALTRSILERTVAELDASPGLAELIGRRDVTKRHLSRARYPGLDPGP